ncbi:MAG: MEKHLA domain-containing protein [Myxacorys chilensis ATA2-1-KO14]|jgi:hypothetical protein|nr:MEKHLA domain-containing protein [Myxacorys chilensis ATA2-1-KO14]
MPSLSDLNYEQHQFVIRHTQRLLHSFYHWTGQSLSRFGSAGSDAIGSVNSEGNAANDLDEHALFHAPLIVLSHGTEADPILNYGNNQALLLWEMDWTTFTQTPSRKTAEPMNREARSRLLAEAKTKGYIDNYRGVRISSTGKRFWIDNVILWTVLDEASSPCGQAAAFSNWQYITRLC